MDLLKRCYRAKFRFTEGSDEETWVRFYWAKPDATLLGLPTAFGSAVFDARDEPPIDPPIGERFGTYSFVNGRDTGGHLGRCHVGTDEQWLHGLSAEDLATPAPPLPACCQAFGTPLQTAQTVRTLVGQVLASSLLSKQAVRSSINGEGVHYRSSVAQHQGLKHLMQSQAVFSTRVAARQKVAQPVQALAAYRSQLNSRQKIVAPCVCELPYGMTLWLRPDEIMGYRPGQAIDTWPAGPGTSVAGVAVAPTTFPLRVVQDTLLGLNAVDVFAKGDGTAWAYLQFSSTVPVGTDFTFYLVARLMQSQGALSGPDVEARGGLTVFLRQAAGRGFFTMVGPYTLNYADTFSEGDLHVWRVRLLTASHVIVDRSECGPFRWVNLVDVPGLKWGIGGIDWINTATADFDNDLWVYETILYPRALTADESAQVDQCLALCYCGQAPPTQEHPDMLIGSIVMDTGTDAVPAQFLLCDGRAVSRANYNLLFARIGVTYGGGDGSTTFNLPNLVDQVIYGSGGQYKTGQVLGHDLQTLTTDQIPAHTHPVNDPGHVHAQNTVGMNPFGPKPNGNYATTFAGPDRQDIIGGTTGWQQTGMTVGANVSAGNPLDVRQQGLALRPLIYAGQ